MFIINSVYLYCVFKVFLECVYCVFIDFVVMVKWLLFYGFSVIMYSFDVRVGGGYYMFFINFSCDKSYFFKVKYLELILG